MPGTTDEADAAKEAERELERQRQEAIDAAIKDFKETLLGPSQGS